VQTEYREGTSHEKLREEDEDTVKPGAL